MIAESAKTCFNNSWYPKHMTDSVNEVCQCLREEMDKRACAYALGISSVHFVQESSVAFIEACCSLNAQKNKKAEVHKQYHSLFSMEGDFEKCLVSYINSIRMVDADRAYALLGSLLIFAKQRLTDSMWHYYTFRIAESVIRFGSENTFFSDHALFPRISELLSHVLSPETPSVFTQLMTEVTSLAIQIMSDVEKQRLETVDDGVLKWLSEHICAPDLSLCMLVEEFGFSQAYWSRRIQDLTGEKFSDIIWKRRLEIVKRELIESKSSLKEIVLQVGYCNVSSFSRRFKEEENMTVN